MNLVWFRNDLRVDNQSLKSAMIRTVNIYFFDPRYYQESDFIDLGN
jgi:deoxyribodipyrimidine photolyase